MNPTRRNFLKKFAAGSLGISSGIHAYPVSVRKASEKTLPVINEVDICVLGGSCTGVFAAVRAAREG